MPVRTREPGLNTPSKTAGFHYKGVIEKLDFLWTHARNETIVLRASKIRGHASGAGSPIRRIELRLLGVRQVSGLTKAMQSTRLTSQPLQPGEQRSSGWAWNLHAKWSLAGLALLPALSAQAGAASATEEAPWLGQVLAALGRLVGNWVNEEALPGFCWGQLLLTGSLLLLVAVATQALRWTLQRNYPQCLPRMRAELVEGPRSFSPAK